MAGSSALTSYGTRNGADPIPHKRRDLVPLPNLTIPAIWANEIVGCVANAAEDEQRKFESGE